MERDYFAGDAPGLCAILNSREARAERQRALLHRYHSPLIVALVNMPGPVKDNECARLVFAAAQRALDAGLQETGCLYHQTLSLSTGPEGYWATPAEAGTLKALCVEIEDRHVWGRLMDLDVIGLDGVPLSRRDTGAAPRPCLVCGGVAAACARSQAHLPEALRRQMEEIIKRGEPNLHG